MTGSIGVAEVSLPRQGCQCQRQLCMLVPERRINTTGLVREGAEDEGDE